MEAQAFRALTSEEKLAHYPSGVMASGESNFFDAKQRVSPSGFAINSIYPSPDDFASGVFVTSPSGEKTASDSIFNTYGLVSDFSNGPDSLETVINRGIHDFTIFNPYIHYYSVEASAGTVVPYGSNNSVNTTNSMGVITQAFTRPMNFGTLSTGVYDPYADREPWNVATSGYDPVANPDWPKQPSGDGSETG